ncbi:hypothetical protein AB7813_14715 [Tardiphaga sp. 20_F10_N6_6]|uniref:hypothetical protein n=1 Tax=Tardiphaga sp. 20_F10_N6_6 TaxID=3240788 RepID=UPI003F8CD96B
MSQLLTRASELLERLISAPYPRPTLVRMPSSSSFPSGVAGVKIPKDNGYFSVRINELFLLDGRTWFETFDPMAVVVTEFLYGDKRLAVPFVVGSELFKHQPGKLPHGLLFNDILVAGPHPFRGGNVSISIVLYKVRRDNYARNVLKFVEGLSSAVGIPADVAFLAKAGESVLDGIEALLGLADTQPIMGHRIELDTSSMSGLSSTTWMLSKNSVDDPSKLVVEDGRLFVRSAEKASDPYRGSDYILYSITGNSRRGDESSLPFYGLRKQAFEAILGGDEGWKRAKAILLSVYQQMVTSDDLTAAEADELFQKYKNELVEAREVFKGTTMLSRAKGLEAVRESRLDIATSILDL